MVTTVDGYEDGDLSEYYINEVSLADVQTSVVQEGIRAVRLDNEGASDSSIVSLSGLPYYPSAGDTIRVWFRGEAAESNCVVGFGWQNPAGPQGGGTGYSLGVRGNQQDLRVRKYQSGSVTKVDGTSISWDASTWYQFEAVWGGAGTPSDYVYESGDPVSVGSPGEHEYEYVSGSPLVDSGESSYAYVSGTGIGGGTGGQITGRLLDAGGTQIGDDVVISDTEWSSGGIMLQVSTFSGGTQTQYYDHYRVL